MRKYPVLHGTHRVLFNRFYFDTFFHILTKRVISTSTILKEYIEKGMDRSIYMVSNRIVAGSQQIFHGFERQFDVWGTAVFNHLATIARTSYYIIELEGLSHRPIKGFNELFNSATGNIFALAQQMYMTFEMGVMERLQTRLLQGNRVLEQRLRSLHTGVLSYNFVMLVFGLLLLISLLFFFGGGSS
jgi:hypothetical protein